MAREYDPLTCIASAQTIRARLDKTEREVRKLRILLDLADRLEAAEKHGDATPQRKEVAHA